MKFYTPKSCFVMAVLLTQVLLAGFMSCAVDEQSVTSESPEKTGSRFGKGDNLDGVELPRDFPSEQDLAVLLPNIEENAIRATDRNVYGRELLPTQWLNQVNQGFLDTVVENAMNVENSPYDWNLVALRLVPCSPLGVLPSQKPDVYCWPQVRLVWQPVLYDFMLVWGVTAPHYSDDRGIHALYRVSANPLQDGDLREPELEEIIAHLKAQQPLGTISYETEQRFLAKRDQAISRLMKGILDLRGDLREGELYGIDIRVESQWIDEERVAFNQRLLKLLDRFAQPGALHALTAMSLPEGREPVMLDLWTFLSFKGQGGSIQQIPIEVIGKDSGNVLVEMSFDQTVTQSTEDDAVMDAIENGPYGEELRRIVITDQSQVPTIGAEIADATRTLVPNTTCAACHKLNHDPFNFHSLSYLENDEVHTVSPRVISDVARDIKWAENYLRR